MWVQEQEKGVKIVDEGAEVSAKIIKKGSGLPEMTRIPPKKVRETPSFSLAGAQVKPLK